jgi:hypothetical protein
MEWFTEIDLYCERIDPGFWAEPLNATSNIAFIIASFWAWHTAYKLGKLDSTIKLLCIMAASVGIGSFLFHTYANLWSYFADVIPVWFFFALYVVVLIIRTPAKSPLRVGAIAAGIIAIIGVIWIIGSGNATHTKASTDVLNGSEQYAPTLIALYFFALVSVHKKNPIRLWIVSAAMIFTLSLIARTVDLHLCETFPHGTHLYWHLLDGLTVGLLLQGLIRIERKETNRKYVQICSAIKMMLPKAKKTN